MAVNWEDLIRHKIEAYDLHIRAEDSIYWELKEDGTLLKFHARVFEKIAGPASDNVVDEYEGAIEVAFVLSGQVDLVEGREITDFSDAFDGIAKEHRARVKGKILGWAQQAQD